LWIRIRFSCNATHQYVTSDWGADHGIQAMIEDDRPVHCRGQFPDNARARITGVLRYGGGPAGRRLRLIVLLEFNGAAADLHQHLVAAAHNRAKLDRCTLLDGGCRRKIARRGTAMERSLEA
jgi:hypothetical protein